jgi:hypothetical protein
VPLWWVAVKAGDSGSHLRLGYTSRRLRAVHLYERLGWQNRGSNVCSAADTEYSEYRSQEIDAGGRFPRRSRVRPLPARRFLESFPPFEHFSLGFRAQAD